MDRKYNNIHETHAAMEWCVWLVWHVEGLSHVAIDPTSPIFSSYSSVMYGAGYKPFFIGYLSIRYL